MLAARVSFEQLFVRTNYKLSNKTRAQQNEMSKQDGERIQSQIELNFQDIIKLTVCVASLIANKDLKLTSSAQQQFRQLTKQFIRFTSVIRNNCLHALALATRVELLRDFNMFNTSDEGNLNAPTITINYDFVEFLLDCGADPNGPLEADSQRNTFLNTTMFKAEFFDDREQCDRFIKLFLDKGAHFDYLNDAGESLIDKYTLKFEKNDHHIFSSALLVGQNMSLKCLASRVIAKNKTRIDYASYLTKDLVAFVERH